MNVIGRLKCLLHLIDRKKRVFLNTKPAVNDCAGEEGQKMDLKLEEEYFRSMEIDRDVGNMCNGGCLYMV